MQDQFKAIKLWAIGLIDEKKKVREGSDQPSLHFNL